MSFIAVFSEDAESRFRMRRIAAEADVDVRTGTWSDEALWSTATLVVLCVPPGAELPVDHLRPRPGVVFLVDTQQQACVSDVDWQVASQLGAQYIVIERLVTDAWIKDLFVRAVHPQRWSPDQQVGSWQR